MVLLIFVSLSSVSQSAGCFPGKMGSDFLSSVEAGQWQRILKKKSLSVCEKEQRRLSQLKKQSESQVPTEVPGRQAAANLTRATLSSVAPHN